MAHTFRRYNRILLAILAPVVLLLVVAGFFLQPYDGGLTRLGGYPEQQYGWNEPQRRFDPPLYKQFMTREAGYREPVDVVVLGDSFTFDDKVSWANYFVQKTGLRLHSFRLDKTPVETLLTSELWRTHPPRVLVYETVERELWNRMQSPTSTCPVQPLPGTAARIIQPLPVQPEPFARETHAALFDFSLSIDFLSKVIPREYFGHDRTPVARLALRQPASFSSLEKSRLLVYRDDLDKARWTPEMWKSIRCGLVALQNRVQSDGNTFFVALIAPDKLTAYSELLVDRRLAALSQLDLLATDPDLHLPRLDLALRQSIRDRVTDIYLNNDTHWGSNGAERVAAELVDYLVRTRVFAPGPSH